MGMNVLWLSRDDVAGRLAGRISDDEITVFDPWGLRFQMSHPPSWCTRRRRAGVWARE
ncbi:MAG: hypothetical protein ACXQT3_02260 [Methermicoccaceae archaeon]